MNLCSKLWILVLTAMICSNATAATVANRKKLESDWQKSIVNVESTRMTYDAHQPWSKRTRSFIKTGIVISPREILTTAEDINDATMIRIQKFGRDRFFAATVQWKDYHANLAILGVKEEVFWSDLKPALMASKVASTEELLVARWKNANLEIRPVDMDQFFVDDGRLSPIASLYMEFDSEMSNIGGAAPVIAGGKLAGLTCQQVENHIRAIPVAFIQHILSARTAGKFTGLGFFPFYWQPSENVTLHQYLGLPGKPRGVAVIFVPKLPALTENLQVRDIILQVDGFDVDTQGYYKDPEYGRLLIENLTTRKKLAGDIIRIKVWREGAEREIPFALPRFDYSSRLVPDYVFDQQPEYLIAGGLVFQPLIKAYLKSWGAEWKRTSPFRLSFYDNEFPTPERRSLVILSMVLPDEFNLGYTDLHALAIEKINGITIRKMTDVKQALGAPKNGFHVVEFVRNDGARKIILDARDLNEANDRVLKRYNIQKIENIQSTDSPLAK